MSQNFESLTLQELQRSFGDSVYTALEPTDWGLRLVCAKEKAADGSGHGASFWVTFVSERWYVCTWRPAYYECPSGVDIRRLCDECLNDAQIRRWIVSAEICTAYGMRQIPDLPWTS
jgi:hypothetical protein